MRKIIYFVPLMILLLSASTILVSQAGSNHYTVEAKVYDVSGSGVEVSVIVTVDPVYNLVHEEIIFTFGEGSVPNLWYDLASKLKASKWELNTRLTYALNDSVQRLTGGSVSVLRAELYTSEIEDYSKLGGKVSEVVLKVWYVGAVKKLSIFSPHILSLAFRRIDIMGILEKEGIRGLEADFSVLKTPLRDWEREEIYLGNSVLPSFLSPRSTVYKYSSGNIEARVIVPKNALYVYATTDSIVYYTLGDLLPIVVFVLTALLLVIAFLKKTGESKGPEVES